MAAVGEEAKRTLRYVELLSAAGTPLADCFSLLPETFTALGELRVSVVVC